MQQAYAIRPATPGDASSIRELIFGILAEYGLAADPALTDSDLSDPVGYYSKRGGTFDVLTTLNGEVVGTVGVIPTGGGRCELRKMYLSASVRGQGLGRRLLSQGLARATELGMQRVELETAGVLQEAIKLYISAGFKPYETAHLSPRCDQAYYLELTPADDPTG